MSGTVLILGGGIAGLTAALQLSARGHAVTVIEQAPRLGGRLQHAPPPLLLEAHTATWSLLDRLGKETLTRKLRHTPLEFLQSTGARIQFLHLPLPSPLNALLGTTLFQGLSMRDRWHLLSFLERTWEQDPPLPTDLDGRAADEWLAGIGQSENARRGVWDSLARLLLGAALPHVSAGLFMRTLRRCFLTGARATKLIIPPYGFDSFLLAPLMAQLDRTGVKCHLSKTATQIHFDRDRVARVELEDRTTLTADWYIAALPRHRLTTLLPERIMTHYAYFQQLSRLSETPLMVVRLHLDHPVEQSQLVLLERHTFHWFIRHPDQELHEQAAVVWAMAVGEPDSLSQPDEEVIRLALKDMAAVFPTASSPRLIQTEIFRAPQAVLISKPGTQQCRPLPNSPFVNLLLAGDWTDTGWPANLESAILSGQRCADAIPA
ncbi:MAG: putative Pytoene desaturase [Nitrospira sp.]|nr:putative Pytoene desaturase [Nitrospira sp.]